MSARRHTPQQRSVHWGNSGTNNNRPYRLSHFNNANDNGDESSPPNNDMSDTVLWTSLASIGIAIGAITLVVRAVNHQKERHAQDLNMTRHLIDHAVHMRKTTIDTHHQLQQAHVYQSKPSLDMHLFCPPQSNTTTIVEANATNNHGSGWSEVTSKTGAEPLIVCWMVKDVIPTTPLNSTDGQLSGGGGAQMYDDGDSIKALARSAARLFHCAGDPTAVHLYVILYGDATYRDESEQQKVNRSNNSGGGRAHLGRHADHDCPVLRQYRIAVGEFRWVSYAGQIKCIHRDGQQYNGWHTAMYDLLTCHGGVGDRWSNMPNVSCLMQRRADHQWVHEWDMQLREQYQAAAKTTTSKDDSTNKIVLTCVVPSQLEAVRRVQITAIRMRKVVSANDARWRDGTFGQQDEEPLTANNALRIIGVVGDPKATQAERDDATLEWICRSGVILPGLYSTLHHWWRLRHVQEAPSTKSTEMTHSGNSLDINTSFQQRLVMKQVYLPMCSAYTSQTYVDGTRHNHLQWMNTHVTCIAEAKPVPTAWLSSDLQYGDLSTWLLCLPDPRIASVAAPRRSGKQYGRGGRVCWDANDASESAVVKVADLIQSVRLHAIGVRLFHPSKSLCMVATAMTTTNHITRTPPTPTNNDASPLVMDERGMLVAAPLMDGIDVAAPSTLRLDEHAWSCLLQYWNPEQEPVTNINLLDDLAPGYGEYTYNVGDNPLDNNDGKNTTPWAWYGDGVANENDLNGGYIASWCDEMSGVDPERTMPVGRSANVQHDEVSSLMADPYATDMPAPTLMIANLDGWSRRWATLMPSMESCQQASAIAVCYGGEDNWQQVLRARSQLLRRLAHERSQSDGDGSHDMASPKHIAASLLSCVTSNVSFVGSHFNQAITDRLNRNFTLQMMAVAASASTL